MNSGESAESPAEANGLREHFGPLEYKIMTVVWSRGVVDVAECAERVDGDSAYTTVKTVMERLVRKGYLDREKRKRSYAYWARQTREQLEAELAAHAAQRLVDGFGALGVANFVDSVRPNSAQLAQLRALLREVSDDEAQG